MPIVSANFEQRAAQRVRNHADDAVEAALALFEREAPSTLDQPAS
jgi:hypothetical protein